MAWNKRGSTSGGASTGRDGGKRGGSGSTADGDARRDVEFADCPTCNGSGRVKFERIEADEDGVFSGTQTKLCSRCSGSGKVTK